MREIKFRAWDTKYKRWENPDGIGLNDGVPFSATGDGYVDDVYTHYPEYVVQQYTGLKDKNGVEIYEGDLVLMNPLHNKPHEVRWHVTGWSAWSPNLHHDFMEYGTDWEVIGNIYENPELLEHPNA